MIISLSKTEVLAQGPGSSLLITITGTQVSTVNNFQYLGSTVTSSNYSLDAELDSRIGSAATTLADFEDLRLYDLFAEHSTLLQRGMATYRRQKHRLSTFCCLCSILGISWQDRVEIILSLSSME